MNLLAGGGSVLFEVGISAWHFRTLFPTDKVSDYICRNIRVARLDGRRLGAGIGTGVKEIRVRDEAGFFRMIYLASCPEEVYVSHCFQKKSQRTSRSDLDLAMKRFKAIAR
jgi:hypothetical protein